MRSPPVQRPVARGGTCRQSSATAESGHFLLDGGTALRGISGRQSLIFPAPAGHMTRPRGGFCVSRLYDSPRRANQHAPAATVNRRPATVNGSTPETASTPANGPLTILLGKRGHALM